MDSKILLAKSIIKTIIEPVVITYLRNFKKYVIKAGLRTKDLIAIVSGGAALERYFDSISHLLTADWDIKMMSPVGSKFDIKTLDPIRVRFGEDMVASINSYISGTVLDKLVVKLEQLGLSLLIKDGEVFTFVKDHKRLSTVRYEIENNMTGEVISENVIDLYIPDIDRDEHFKTWTRLNTECDVYSLGNDSDYHIPVNKFDHVYYAALGYIIWDTDRMIKNSIEKGLPKLERYQRKKAAILAALNKPQNYLTCYTMAPFTEKCSLIRRRLCSDADGKPFTRQELISTGVENDIFNEIYRRELAELSNSYLCDLYERLRIRFNEEIE